MFWSWVKRHVAWPSASSGSAPDGPLPLRAPATTPSRGEPQWQRLRPVQRVLDRPLAPVAPLDTFTGSLAAHQNPSFLAPLRHIVDPHASGGLVTGLAIATAGVAIPYAGNAQLVVPTAPKKPATLQRGPVTSTAASVVETPPTEKPVAPRRSLPVVAVPPPRRSTSPATNVRELPVIARFAAPQRSEDDAPISPEQTPPIGTDGPPEPLGGFSAFSAAIASLQDEAPPPAVGPAHPPASAAAPGDRPAPQVQRRRADRSTRTSKDGAEHASPARAGVPGVPGRSPQVQPAPGAGTTPPRAELPAPPALQRMPVLPVVDSAPRRSPSARREDQSAPHSPAPHSPASQPPTPPVQVQGSPAPRHPPHTSAVDETPDAAHAATPRDHAEPDVPAVSREALTNPPVEPTHTTGLLAGPPPPRPTAAPLQRPPKVPVVDGAPSVPTVPADPTMPDSPARPAVTGETTTARPAEPPHTVGLLAEQPPPRPASAPLQRLPELPAPARALQYPAPAHPRIHPGPPDANSEAAHPDHDPAAGAPASPVHIQRSAVTNVVAEAAASSLPAAARHTVGLLADRPPLLPAQTAVRVESVPARLQRVTSPAASSSHTTPAPRVPLFEEMARNRSTARQQAHPLLGGAAGQQVPLQRRLPAVAAHVTGPQHDGSPGSRGLPGPLPAGSTPATSQRPTPQEQPIHTVGPAMSFASMFSTPAAGASLAGADGFTSVQLQQAGAQPGESPRAGTRAPANQPPSDPPSPAAPVAPVADGATSPVPAPVGAPGPKDDLDEMARRLFEPLSARLRAELWLDRERAGLIADVRR